MIVRESIEKPRTLYVYVITNNINGKQYVGSRICYKKDVCKDSYFGSSKYLKDDIIKYGKENFSKEILNFYQDPSELLDEETKYIFELNTLFPNGYNRFIPNKAKGFYSGMKDKKHSLISREKMKKPHKFSEDSLKSLKSPKTEEHKENMRKNHANVRGENNPMFGKSIYDIWVEKYGEEKAKEKMKQSFKKLPDERKQKISKSLLGKFKGKDSPVYGKSVHARLVKKYGEEEANKLWKESNIRRSRSLINNKNASKKK